MQARAAGQDGLEQDGVAVQALPGRAREPEHLEHGAVAERAEEVLAAGLEAARVHARAAHVDGQADVPQRAGEAADGQREAGGHAQGDQLVEVVQHAEDAAEEHGA